MGGFGDIANSGTMPISGGEAKSGNGDQKQTNSSVFGGLNYGASGVSPLLIFGIVVAVLVAVVVLKK
jgi:hypothetical protein